MIDNLWRLEILNSTSGTLAPTLVCWLLEAFNQIKVAEGSNVAVHISLGIRGHDDAVNGIDSSGIGWIQLLPYLPLSGRYVDLAHLGWNLTVAKDKQGPSIRRPAGRGFIGLDARNQGRLATVYPQSEQ